MTTPGKPLAVVRLYQPETDGVFQPPGNLNLQVRLCGDEENRTLNPRLANSDQCVRHRLSTSLTCANSSSMIAEYPRCAGSRQHFWQHSPAIAGGQADGDWGLPGVDIGVPR